MKQLSQTGQFAKDVKRLRKRGKDIEKPKAVVTRLASGQALEPRYRDYALAGEWKNCRDCHLEPDWVLIYSTDERYLRLERTGSHSDLFD